MTPPLPYQGFFFDMDGVLYLGGDTIPGAQETLQLLVDQGKYVAVVTNNSGQTAADVSRRLDRLGFPADALDVIIATEMTARWLAEQNDSGTVYVLGSDGLKSELTGAGLRLCPDPGAVDYACDFLVVGNDSNISYDKLTAAIRVGRAGATFVAVNSDHLFPSRNGLRPGGGALVNALASGIGRPADVLVGKPSPFLINEAMRLAGLKPDQCLMIGDTLDIDIRMGVAAGASTALVLSGVDNERTLKQAATPPTYVWRSVADMIGLLTETASV